MQWNNPASPVKYTGVEPGNAAPAHWSLNVFLITLKNFNLPVFLHITERAIEDIFLLTEALTDWW